MRDDTKTNLRAPTTGDPHYPFYRHLLAGGTVHRSDPLNKVEADLTLADMKNEKAENIQYYGYSDLSIVPLPIKPFDNYEISPVVCQPKWHSG